MLAGPPLLTLLGADGVFVGKNNIAPDVCSAMDVDLCESKSFRFGICRQERSLSGVLPFQACFVEPLTDQFVSDIATNDVPNLTRCHIRVFTGIFDHSVVLPFSCFESTISS